MTRHTNKNDDEMADVHSQKLNLAQHNIRSISANKPQLINYLEKNNIHIYIASETWLKPKDDRFFLKNYQMSTNNRKDGYGGVAILLKNGIHFEDVKIPPMQHVQVTAIITTNLHKNLTIFSVYIPPRLSDPDPAKNIDESKV